MLAERTLPVAGITPLTTIDWPDHLAAVVYTRGCPWRCPYCHNYELQSVVGDSYEWEKVLSLLNTRRGLLDGVVFTGGEPCLHDSLIPAMEEIRALGFGIALHTGGGYPKRLEQILSRGLVDWVGLDMKAPWELYEKVTQKPGSGARAKTSLSMLIASGVEYEVRTTVWQQVLDQAKLEIMAGQLAELGASPWVLQACRECPRPKNAEPQEIAIPNMVTHLNSMTATLVETRI